MRTRRIPVEPHFQVVENQSCDDTGGRASDDPGIITSEVRSYVPTWRRQGSHRFAHRICECIRSARNKER